VNITLNSTEPTYFELISLQGSSLVKQQFKDYTSIDVTGITPGTYLLKVFNKDFAEHKKLIIK